MIIMLEDSVIYNESKVVVIFSKDEFSSSFEDELKSVITVIFSEDEDEFSSSSEIVVIFSKGDDWIIRCCSPFDSFFFVLH